MKIYKVPAINSVHLLAIVLHFNSIEEQRHSPSYWKFNASLLDDHDFVRLITERVREEFKEGNDKRVLWDN